MFDNESGCQTRGANDNYNDDIISIVMMLIMMINNTDTESVF